MYLLLFNEEIITAFQPDRETIDDDAAMATMHMKETYNNLYICFKCCYNKILTLPLSFSSNCF